jgi:hypothetical protein
MKNVILITIALGSLMMSACSKHIPPVEKSDVVHNIFLDCSDIENNLVDGLPSNLGQTPSTPSNVQKGIIYYRDLAKSGDQNSSFYTSNADLMEAKLNSFNERFFKECN